MKDFNIPLLTAEDIDCRVQSVSKAKNGTVGAVLLLYKDARVDMRILDQVFGPGNWQRTHELINGNLFCTIEIWDDEKAAWVKKQDVGVESNTEKEKGQASDAFKRAGFNVGIGRELYSAPFTYVELNDGEWKVEKVQGRDVYRTYPNVKFSVTKIGYNDRREIVDLTIVDRFGNVRFLCEGGVQKKANQSGQGSRQNAQSGRQAQTTAPDNASAPDVPESAPGRPDNHDPRRRCRLSRVRWPDQRRRARLFPSQVRPRTVPQVPAQRVKGGVDNAKPYH